MTSDHTPASASEHLDLINRLQAGIDDPMWAHHFEIHKAEAARIIAALSATAGATKPAKVYLVCTGEVYEGQETYTRHDSAPQMCDFETLYASPKGTSGSDALDARDVKMLRDWIEEALIYVGSPSWSPSLVSDGKRVLAAISSKERS
jgi:hypothetical protein